MDDAQPWRGVWKVVGCEDARVYWRADTYNDGLGTISSHIPIVLP